MISSLYAKNEATYGTAETITGTELCLAYGDLAAAFQIVTEQVSIDPITGSMTPVHNPAGVTTMTSAFDILLQGSGAPAAEPYWGKFLKSCGMAMTSAVVSTDTVYTYKPTDTLADHKGLTLKLFRETNEYLGIGLRGNFSCSMDAGGMMRASFNYQGLCDGTVTPAQTPPAGTLQAQRSPTFWNTAFAIGAHTTGVISRFAMDAGVGIERLMDANAATSLNGLHSINILRRQPTFNIMIAADTGLPYDFFTKMKTGAFVDDITFTATSVDGADKITFTIRDPQITATPVRNDRGMLFYDVAYRGANATKNNDWELKVATTTT